MAVNGQVHAPAALPPAEVLGNNWIRGWAGPRRLDNEGTGWEDGWAPDVWKMKGPVNKPGRPQTSGKWRDRMGGWVGPRRLDNEGTG
jgi:hypothetical protein